MTIKNHQLSTKTYKCSKCEAEDNIETNHYGELYLTCNHCRELTIWNCIDEVPDDAWVPTLWEY